MTALKNALAILLTCALIFALSAQAIGESNPITVYVAKDNAKVYNAEGEVVSSVELNAVLTCTGVKGDICRVERDGHTAYMKKSDLSKHKTEEPEAINRTAYVAVDGAKVYNANRDVIGHLSLNTQVTVTATKGSACRVTLDGKTGYMYAADLSADKVEGKAEEKPDDNADTQTLKFGDKGEEVKKVQTRLKALGYFTGSIGGNYQTLTQSAVTAFQTQAGLTATGDCDTKTLEILFSDGAPKMPQAPSSATPAKGRAREADWWTSEIQSVFPRGAIVTVTDVETGLSWREQRRGGTNHADVQPLTAADTAVLKRVYGGTWSWDRRAIFVTINGVNYAASMNGMPHGGGEIEGNIFNGHHCIHFTNSRTHSSNKVCSLHQAAIKKALAVTL